MMATSIHAAIRKGNLARLGVLREHWFVSGVAGNPYDWLGFPIVEFLNHIYFTSSVLRRVFCHVLLIVIVVFPACISGRPGQILGTSSCGNGCKSVSDANNKPAAPWVGAAGCLECVLDSSDLRRMVGFSPQHRRKAAR